MITHILSRKMSSNNFWLAFVLLLNIFSIRGLSQKGCDVKHAYYNIVCSRFEFWCSTKRNVLTYEAICKNITLSGKSVLNLDTPEKIFDIEIYSSNIPIITSGMFINYPNMARLYIQTGNTKEIQGNAFKGASQLDWLIVKNNNITTIQPKAFIGLGKLNVLNMNLNDLTELKEHTFEGLDSLQYLSLKENKIAIIEDNTFSKLKKLGVLFLNDNLLTVITDWMFVENVALRITWFQNNKIQSFPDNFFKYKPLLNECTLNNNNVSVVNYEGFNGNLSINNNKIQKLFQFGVVSTDYLDLSFNNINSIPPNIFVSCNNLNTLLLNNNSIDAIHEDAFRNLTKLQTLRLDNNEIFDIPLGLFQDLKYLVTLNLSYNQIQHIETGTFTGLISLDTLDLSNNKISVLQMSALYTLKELRTFYFNENSLETIDIDNLILHLISLKEINLENNLWTCDWLSANLVRLDSKLIKIIHGTNMKTSNVHGISCSNSAYKIPESSLNMTESSLAITESPCHCSTETAKLLNDAKPKEALHTSEKPASGHSANIHILTGFAVFAGIVIILFVVRKYVWKRKIIIRKVDSNETISYKLDLVDE